MNEVFWLHFEKQKRKEQLIMSTALDRKDKEEEEIQIPGWYFEFVGAVVRQLPRPGNGKGRINKKTAIGYSVAQAKLQKALADALLPKQESVKSSENSIIDIVDTVSISATTEKFVAKQKFVKDSKEIKFYGIWDNFTSWFLAGDGKIEEHVGEQTLSYGNLTKDSVDGPIIEELLCGEAKVETTLSAVYGLLLKQSKGEEGALLTNGYANIFYVKDVNGTLRAVDVIWRVGGWYVRASSVEYTGGWYAGSRVFSANS